MVRAKAKGARHVRFGSGASYHHGRSGGSYLEGSCYGLVPSGLRFSTSGGSPSACAGPSLGCFKKNFNILNDFTLETHLWQMFG